MFTRWMGFHGVTRESVGLHSFRSSRGSGGFVSLSSLAFVLGPLAISVVSYVPSNALLN